MPWRISTSRRLCACKPRSAAARTNLATNLIQMGKREGAGEQLRKAVALEPKSYDANHNLGELYVELGQTFGGHSASQDRPSKSMLPPTTMATIWPWPTCSLDRGI